MAYCYRRAGALNEARDLLCDVLARLGEDAPLDLRCLATLRCAIVEQDDQRPRAALDLLRTAAPLFEAHTDELMRGYFHNELAASLTLLAAAEDQPDFQDQALVEYAAAAYYFERCGHERYLARVANNVGYLHTQLGDYDRAHEQLERARDLFLSLGDALSVAQVDETRARALISARRYEEAIAVATAAVAAFDRSDRSARLTEALTSYGIALARAGRRLDAREAFERAAHTGESAGDLAGAGLAYLTLLEEAGGTLGAADVVRSFKRADDLLDSTTDRDIAWRLRVVARCVVEYTAHASPRGAHSWAGFNLKDEMRRYEAKLIELALKDSGGSLTNAARLLGITHQALDVKLKQQHPSLLSRRRAILPRRKSVITKQ